MSRCYGVSPACRVGDSELGERWRVAPTDSLLDRLKELIGHEQVEVVYER